MARRGNILEGIRAGINSYMQMRSMMGKIRMQELQRQAYRRQMAGYESPEEKREAAYQDWKRRRDYVRQHRTDEEQQEPVTLSEEQIKAAASIGYVPLQNADGTWTWKKAGTTETPETGNLTEKQIKLGLSQGYVPLQKADGTWTWRRRYSDVGGPAAGGAGGGGAGGGAGGPSTIDVKRIQGLVTDMITDLRMDTKMDEVWPIMIPAQVRDKVESLMASGATGRAKGYLHSNYIFSSPQVKKKIQRLLDTLDTDLSYDDVASVISSAQAGLTPQPKEGERAKTPEEKKYARVLGVLRNNRELAEMFAQVGDMASNGVPLDNIAPYVESATTALYPGGKEPAGRLDAVKGWFRGKIEGANWDENENYFIRPGPVPKAIIKKAAEVIKGSSGRIFNRGEGAEAQAAPGGFVTPASLEEDVGAINPKDEALNENIKIRMNK